MQLKLDVAQRIVAADKIAAGTWMQVRTPDAAKDPIYLDEDGKYPARVLVLSYRDKTFQDRVYKANAAQAATRKTRAQNTNEMIHEATQKARPRNFSWLVLAMENLDSSQPGVILRPSEADLEELAQQPEYQWLVDQVMNHAYSDENYGAEAEAGNADAAE